MNTRLEFIVSLLDRVSAPAGKVMRSLDQMTKQAEAGYRRIGYGVAGLVGAGYGVANLVDPARQMNRALGEVASMDVAPEVLRKLDMAAKKFSVEYGESAAAFVSSAYDIQGAIAGLVGDELPAFTYAGNLLAKGTKADAATITDFMGTMYGIFQKTADSMGRARWVEMMAGQTAMAVNVFKSSGKGMSDAFVNLGANATTMGVAMNEQMAVLGQLQATMKGSEAGTKYRAFLTGVGKAQKELGLSFVDSHGKMLPMVDILTRIKGKFGEIDTVAESDLLKKAFGTDEAVGLVKLLMTDIDGLAKNIDAIGNVKGLDELTKMAQPMVDPIDRATAGVTALSIAIGQKMMASITPTIDKFVEMEKRLLGWTEQFPKLTGLIGKGILAVFGLIAGVSLLSVAVGVSKFLLIGWQAGMMLLSPAFTLLRLAIFNVLPAVWGFTTALLASPVTWIVLGIAALVAIVAAAVIYWDQWTSAVIGWASALGESSGLFALVDNLIAAWNKLPVWWDATINWLLAKFDMVSAWWTRFTGWLSSLNPFAGISAAIDGLLGKLGQIPGVGSLVKSILPSAPAPTPPPAALSAAGRANVPAGGIAGQMARQSGGRSVGAVNVFNYGQPMSGQQLANELAFAAP
jgi:TP901 family phage tail tape measure protein